MSATPPGDEDPSTYVVPNKDTDVAAPTAGAISVNANGQVCVVDQIATSWAAAEVSGILALLSEQYPRETPKQLVARLQATTEGAGAPQGADGRSNPWTGPGSCRRTTRSPARSSPDARAGSSPRSPRSAPTPRRRPRREPIDLLGTPRAILLWSGLVAGSLLALAFMLRPLLRR